MEVRSKIADQNHIFDITLRLYNIFSISFLYSFVVGGKNGFSINPRWRLQLIFSIPAAILDFVNNLISIKFASYQHQLNAKRRLENFWILSKLCKKINFDTPFWIGPPFLSLLTKYALDPCCWKIQNTNILENSEVKLL
jgi:hypothetical protein